MLANNPTFCLICPLSRQLFGRSLFQHLYRCRTVGNFIPRLIFSYFLTIDPPSSKISSSERELQLLDELHRLRTNFNRVLDENEDLRKERYRKRTAIPSEKEMAFRHEAELEQLQLKITTLEKQSRSGKEFNRSEDDTDTLKPVTKVLLSKTAPAFT